MSNVYHFPLPKRKPSRRLSKYDRLQQHLLRRAELRAEPPASPWDELTSVLGMEKNRRGTLPPGIVEAFLVAAGIPVPR
jgi:hypothetical protein